MKILVTGATGFVGLNIVSALLAQGLEVVGVGHAPPPAEALVALPGHDCVAWHITDLRDAAAVQALFAQEKPDRVVHGAAVTTAAGRDGEAATATAAVNIMAALHVLDAAAAQGTQRLVFLSSASVYGTTTPAQGLLDEALSLPQPSAVYGITKLAAERLLLRAGPLRGVQVFAARLGGVFGRFERDSGLRDTLSPMHQVMQAARLGQPIILPRPGSRDWIYAPDVAEGVAALLLAEAPASPVYNLSSPVIWSVAEWCAALALRSKIDWRLAGPDEPATVDFHGPDDRPPLATARAQQDFGFRARFGMAEALTDYLDWLQRSPPEGDTP
ncbi:NAD-dependent epimerase/dehydratase family protein [Falsiroseomonas sp. E2-1-a20]|uniref:NAD-dependent epimerase/dehydratase family protein n=1 Tax=Falsiroseomonas sp. E2-1-a20 TaxID=3239300 RepID=UPI003F3EF6AF